MRVSLLALTLVFGFATVAEAKPPEVVVYGASWCGPCRSLKAFLEKAGIPHDFLDVDDSKNFEAFERAALGERGIPLTIINGRDRIRGLAPEKLMSALGREAATQSSPPKSGVELYGGKSAQDWQREFRELRAYQKTLEARLEQLAKVAEDDVETAEVDRLKKRVALAEDSLVLLDNDASRYALPRKYRQ